MLGEALWVAVSREGDERDAGLADLMDRIGIEGLFPQVSDISTTWKRNRAIWAVEAALAAGDTGLALELVEGLDPDDGDAVYLRACVLVQSGEFEAAEELVAGAPEGDGRFESVAVSIRTGREQAAGREAEVVRQAALLEAEAVRQAAVRGVEAALAAGDTGLALELVEGLDPDDGDAVYLRACVLVQMGALDEAKEQVELLGARDNRRGAVLEALDVSRSNLLLDRFLAFDRCLVAPDRELQRRMQFNSRSVVVTNSPEEFVRPPEETFNPLALDDFVEIDRFLIEVGPFDLMEYLPVVFSSPHADLGSFVAWIEACCVLGVMSASCGLNDRAESVVVIEGSSFGDRLVAGVLSTELVGPRLVVVDPDSLTADETRERYRCALGDRLGHLLDGMEPRVTVVVAGLQAPVYAEDAGVIVLDPSTLGRGRLSLGAEVAFEDAGVWIGPRHRIEEARTGRGDLLALPLSPQREEEAGLVVSCIGALYDGSEASLLNLLSTTSRVSRAAAAWRFESYVGIQ